MGKGKTQIIFTYLVFIFSVLTISASLMAQDNLPSDKLASAATVNLYRNLQKNLGKGVLFGHQDDLAYGLGWFGDQNRSNLNDVIGDYPSVFGWELGGLEMDAEHNLDNVSFEKMREYIKQSYQRGSVITISWHLNNPINLSSSWDTSKAVVKEILPGGSRHDLYLLWLDKIALFLNSLKTSKGEMIPILFRPFHELTGNWFWWGQNRCSPEEYKALMRMTIGYLRETKEIHHLLYVYNTDFFNSKEAYLERYPGNDIIDILSVDYYQQGDTEPEKNFVQNLDMQLGLLESIAAENKKIPAIAETGYKKIPYSKWWTEFFLKAISHHQLSYALFWRDGGMVNGDTPGTFNPSDVHFLPTKDHASAPDFIKMCSSGKFIFQRKAAAMHLYRN
jgi:hypothetical protein